jgi:hypothetical protein
VPRERLDSFLRIVAAALKPGGKVFFVDSHPRHQPAADGSSQVLTRRLSDGRTFRIVKNRYALAELVASCAAAGLMVQATASVFMVGIGRRQR